MICVTSAGNSGNDGIIAPADAFDVISVGAVDSNGELTWLLNKQRLKGLIKMGMSH